MTLPAGDRHDELRSPSSTAAELASERSIIDLAHNLRLIVIAEGVETKEVRELLLARGCDAAQGHFISRPAPAAVISAWMAQRPGATEAPAST